MGDWRKGEPRVLFSSVLCGGGCVSLVAPVLMRHFPSDDCGPEALVTLLPPSVPQSGGSFLLLSVSRFPHFLFPGPLITQCS